MAAKQKEQNDDNRVDPYLEPGKNPELEKKIDEMMSMEPAASPKPEPTKIEVLHDEPASEVMQVTSDFSLPAEENVGAPLLPDDLVAANIEKIDEASKKPPEPEPEPEPSKDVVDLPVPDEKTTDELGLEDVGTGQAVDEIIASEADELIAVQDRRAAAAEPVQPAAPHKKSSGKGIGAFFSAWLHSKRYRYMTLAALFVAAAAVATVPTSRYTLLNSFGVRSAASVTVLDETTGQPLKNVEFIISEKSGRTDKEGTVKLDGLRLGQQNIVIKKAGFADISRLHTFGWGSNPLGEFRLKSVGSQYKINVQDFLSKKPIAKAEASSGDANALSNEKGEIVLTVPRGNTDQEQIEVQLSGDGLRTENIKLALGKKDAELVSMVPSRKHVFISKRSGTYDLYKVDADGKNEEKVLNGTGSERPESIAVSIHPTKNIVALVSARDNSRNKDGFVLSSLTMIDLSDNQSKPVAQSERVQMVGWIDNKLTYVKIAEGASAASPDRHRLISYDIDSATEKELASTNYFNDILMVGKSIYYTPAAYNVNGSVGLFKINSDGSDKKTIYDKEVWNLFRTSYDKLSVSMGQDWFDLNLSTDVLTRATSAPPILKTRVYVNKPGNSLSLWTDERDGKGVLLSYDESTKTDAVLRSQSGLKNPVRWLSDKHIIYRVSNNQETADYILSTDGGEPLKIGDVTDTAGIDRWYYY